MPPPLRRGASKGDMKEGQSCGNQERGCGHSERHVFREAPELTRVWGHTELVPEERDDWPRNKAQCNGYYSCILKRPL